MKSWTVFPRYKTRASPAPRRAHTAQIALAALVAVPSQAAIRRLHELLYANAAPASSVEEPYPAPAEEPLAPSVARRAPLPRHRPRGPVPVAYPDPPRPAITTAAVAAPARTLSLLEPGARLPRGRVRGPGVGRCADGPADRHPVEAADRRRWAALSRGDAGLGDVGDPRPVWLVGAEAMPAPLVRAGVLGLLGRPARMRAASALLPGRAGDRIPLLHDFAHGPLADPAAWGVVYPRRRPQVPPLPSRAPAAAPRASAPSRSRAFSRRWPRTRSRSPPCPRRRAAP